MTWYSLNKQSAFPQVPNVPANHFVPNPNPSPGYMGSWQQVQLQDKLRQVSQYMAQKIQSQYNSDTHHNVWTAPQPTEADPNPEYDHTGERVETVSYVNPLTNQKDSITFHIVSAENGFNGWHTSRENAWDGGISHTVTINVNNIPNITNQKAVEEFVYGVVYHEVIHSFDPSLLPQAKSQRENLKQYDPKQYDPEKPEYYTAPWEVAAHGGQVGEAVRSFYHENIKYNPEKVAVALNHLLTCLRTKSGFDESSIPGVRNKSHAISQWAQDSKSWYTFARNLTALVTDLKTKANQSGWFTQDQSATPPDPKQQPRTVWTSPNGGSIVEVFDPQQSQKMMDQGGLYAHVLWGRKDDQLRTFFYLTKSQKPVAVVVTTMDGKGVKEMDFTQNEAAAQFVEQRVKPQIKEWLGKAGLQPELLRDKQLYGEPAYYFRNALEKAPDNMDKAIPAAIDQYLKDVEPDRPEDKLGLSVRSPWDEKSVSNAVHSLFGAVEENLKNSQKAKGPGGDQYARQVFSTLIKAVLKFPIEKMKILAIVENEVPWLDRFNHEFDHTDPVHEGATAAWMPYADYLYKHREQVKPVTKPRRNTTPYFPKGDRTFRPQREIGQKQQEIRSMNSWYKEVKAEMERFSTPDGRKSLANGGLTCQKCGKPLAVVREHCEDCDPHKGKPVQDTAYHGRNPDHRATQSRVY